MLNVSNAIQHTKETDLAAAERRFAEASERVAEAYRDLEDQRHAARAAQELSGPVAHPDVVELEYPDDVLGIDPHPEEP